MALHLQSGSGELATARTHAIVADGLAISRPIVGALLGAHTLISNDHNQSWKPFFIHTITALGDVADGKLKRHAREIDPSIPDRPSLDDLTDKAYFYEIVGSLAAKECAEGSYVHAGFLGGVALLNAARDTVVTKKRQQAKHYGLKINAGNAGKAKTLVAGVALGTLLSPMNKHRGVKTAGMAMLGVETALSVVSGLQYYLRFNRQIRQKNRRKRIEPVF